MNWTCICCTFQTAATTAGGLFATLQSTGAVGFGAASSAGIFGFTGGTTVVMSYLFGESCEKE